MTDLYIATPTQADYDALMRLAEAAGYEWYRGKKPTALNFYNEYVENGGQVVHFGVESKALMHCDREYFGKMGATIETIPNLANIKAIWKVSRENRDAFTMKHRLPPHYKSARKLYVICDEYSETYTTEENEIYKSLAVEYKPKESEVMPEKVKLPKGICAYLDRLLMEHPGFKAQYPFVAVGVLREKRSEPSTDELQNEFAAAYVNLKSDNQWKLIDALRYGYEAEPEPRWGIKAGHSYLYEPNDKSFGPDEEPFAYDLREQAEEVVARLGFGEVVDLNKEGKDDDSTE
ncbi:hypothetical protein LTWDN19_18740 [Latilactobacillus curvatus]|uniref:Uncharacterized protein n=1 Tax=Latilactobacillus curvatus TaxID=28038 RepID=A0ABM7QWB8_LATCU|nr:hypothetical protein [Latilactobacillus curvatus]BCX31307.1 hypothetical protein LTWDN19_18740 [Latilactobacillus curvatus]